MRTITPAFLILTLTGVEVIAKDFYRWTDDEHVVHYTDKAPVAEQVEPVPVFAGHDEDHEEKLEELRRQSYLLTKKREQKRKADNEARAAEDKLAAHCQKAQETVASVQLTPRRQTVNAQGEREYMTPEQREAWVNHAQGQIDQHCK
ncbi:MAG: hypothetical protein AAF384_18020 [Pseudomonadota bacterium]